MKSRLPIGVLARISTIHAVAAVVIAASGAPARAVNSYISFQGSFSAQGQTQTFDFSLGANALTVMRTWGNPGGVNAAGEDGPEGDRAGEVGAEGSIWTEASEASEGSDARSSVP